MIKSLISVYFRSCLSGIANGKRGKNGTYEKSPGRVALVAVLYAFLILMFLMLSATTALSLGTVFIGRSDWLYFGIFMLAAFSIVFIFGTIETKGVLFECKDNELLLSMPIKARDIIIARASVVFIFNYVETAVIALPALIIYAVLGGAPLSLLSAFVTFLILPLPATALSAIVGFVIAKIAAKLKNRSIVTAIIWMIFLALYFVVYYKFISSDGILGGAEENPDAVESSFSFLRQIGLAATGRPLNFVIFVLGALLVTAAVFAIISKNYFRMIQSPGAATRKRRAEKQTAAREKPVLAALVSKEISRFFGSAAYIVNCGVGLVFSVVVAIIALIKADILRGIIAEMTENMGLPSSPEGILGVFGIALVLVLSSMCDISSCALSLEGRSLWILKTLPIEDTTVVLSKTLPHIIISLPPLLVSYVIIMIASGAGVIYWITGFLTVIFATVTFAALGSVMNILLPKLDFTNETQVIKQSASVTLTILPGMLFTTVAFIGAAALSLLVSPLVAAIAMMALFAALAAVMCVILLGPMTRKYASL